MCDELFSFVLFISVPLLHVLSVHVRVLIEWPLWRSWATLCGLPINDSSPVPSHCLELIPSLLVDPIALLLKYILLAPLHLDQGSTTLCDNVFLIIFKINKKLSSFPSLLYLHR